MGTGILDKHRYVYTRNRHMFEYVHYIIKERKLLGNKSSAHVDRSGTHSVQLADSLLSIPKGKILRQQRCPTKGLPILLLISMEMSLHPHYSCQYTKLVS